VDFSLTDEQLHVQEIARDFTNNEVIRAPTRTLATTTSTWSWRRRSPLRAISARSCQPGTAA
jgi:hypothetical protein